MSETRQEFNVRDRVLYSTGRIARSSEPYTSGELIATGTVVAVKLHRPGTGSERLLFEVRFDKELFPGSCLAPTRSLWVEAGPLKPTTRRDVRGWRKITKHTRRSARRKPAPSEKGTTG